MKREPTLSRLKQQYSDEYGMTSNQTEDSFEFALISIMFDRLEELELFKSEHLRLEAELNAILHPNGDGPTAPSFCDLVAYVQADLQPKLCNSCEAFGNCDVAPMVEDKGCGLHVKR